MQREHVHEAAAGQEDADQEGCDDHVDKASQDKGDGAARVPDVGTQTRPRKPPDVVCIKLKKIAPGLLRTGILMMLLMLVMTNPTLILKRTGPLTKTRSLMVCPMMMISEIIQMETCGDDNMPDGIEDEIGNAEKNHTKTIALHTV